MSLNHLWKINGRLVKGKTAYEAAYNACAEFSTAVCELVRRDVGKKSIEELMQEGVSGVIASNRVQHENTKTSRPNGKRVGRRVAKTF